MATLTKFIPLSKVDLEKRLVYGLATAEAPDRADEICDYASTKPFYQKWSQEIAKSTNGKSLGNVRAMHGNIAAGKLTEITFDDVNKCIEICAKVVDDAEWEKVREGVYTGFSQGGKYVKRWSDKDTGFMRYTAEPVEVSLVDVPCLPSATFSVIKSAGVVEEQAFKTIAPEPASKDVMDRAYELAKAAGADDPTDEQLDQARKALLDESVNKAISDLSGIVGHADIVNITINQNGEAVVKPTIDDEPIQQPDAVSVVDLNVPDGETITGATPLDPAVTIPKSAKPGKLRKSAQFWSCNCLDHRHEIRADAEKCIKTSEAEESLKAATAPVETALEELQRFLGATEAEATATETVAETVAKAEPLLDAAGHAGLLAFHICKSSDEDIAAALAHGVAKQAISKGADDAAQLSIDAVALSRIALGDAFKDAPLADLVKAAGIEPVVTETAEQIAARKARVIVVGHLGKGLPTVSRLACLIEELKWVETATRMEADMEGDNSPVVGRLQADIASICATLVAMVQEETSELVAGMTADEGGIELLFAAAMPEQHHIDALVKFMSGLPDLTPVADAFAKAHVGELESATAALTRAVEGQRELAKAGRRNNSADQNRIQKVHDLATELGADCEAAAGKGVSTPEGETLEKVTALTTENANLKSALADYGVKLSAVLKDVQALKASPAPAKAAIFSVSKDSEAALTTGSPAGPTDAEIAAKLSAMSPDERARLLMKGALANGVPMNVR